MDDTVFVHEIQAQPESLRAVADYYEDPEGQTRLRQAVEVCLNRRMIVFTGMGSSMYVPHVVFRELLSPSPSMLILDACELLHFGLDGIRGDQVMIAISQSGESAETRQVVQDLKGKVPVISIVNDQGSTMGRSADYVLPIYSGEETSISSKSYTNTLAVLLLLVDALNRKDIATTLTELRQVADQMEHTLEDVDQYARRASTFFGALTNLHLIGRGADLVTARQWALIIKEGARVFSEAFTAGMFRHGPIEMAGAGHAAVFITSRNYRPELTCGLAQEVADIGSKVLVLSDTPCRGNANMMNVVLAGSAPRYFPIVCAPFFELFVHHAAKRRGREAGIFQNSHKITARE